jgi:glutamate--cysteine ligase
MTTRLSSDDDETQIDSVSDLADYLASGCKPADAWRLGTEHEKLVFRKSDLAPPSYAVAGGIRDLLKGFERFGWQPVSEGDNVIALKRGKASISLEPGGQYELSGAPLATVHETAAETAEHIRECHEIGDELGLAFLASGFVPNQTRSAIPIMPKGRYAIMMRHMPRVGTLGLDMMLRTCTVQVNLDYASEADMVKKFRVSLALQPLATALFANSPFVEGKPSGYRSYRSHIWTDTDPHRTGMLPFVFEDGFGFERYADYMLNVPMYFVFRDGGFIDCAGLSFRDFLDGKLAPLPGERPTLADWQDHLSTAFPEVRLKTFLEMRGADTGPPDRINALAAFWTGIFYDGSALDAAWDLVKDWTIADHAALRRNVPRQALQTPLRGGDLQGLAREVLQIADAGLRARGRLNSDGQSEQIYLAPLHEIADSGQTPADLLLAAYEERWSRDVTGWFGEGRY